LLAQKPLRHIPDRDATPKRLQRSLEMQNSLALYDVPNKLLIQTTPRAIPYRNGDNISLLTFYADGYNAEPAQPWELYSFREFPEMFKNNAELEKELKEGVRRNLEALRLKALDKKAHCKYLIANMNLLHIPYWARERFFKCYPSCNPKYIRRHFSEKGFKYPIHPCALSKEAEKLTVGMVDELFANLPLDGLILTIGDNSGNWQCYNDEHKHHKDFLKQSEENNNKEKNTKSTRTTAGAGPGGLYYPDMDYAEKAMLNIIKWVYAGMKKHREKPILLLRAWAGPGLFIGDDSRCNAFLEKVYKIVPKEDFFVVCKHASPPSMDYCWKPASYSPLFNHKSLQKFAILGWGEDQGAKSIVPVSIWYDWPDIIQRDIKWLSAHGMMGTPMGISFSGSRPEQELSHVAAGCLLRDPDLDLKALKKRWATYRFGEKAGAHVLAAIEYGPKILEKHTLYHKGEEQMDSLHFLSLDGKSHYRNQRAAPPWLKVVNQENYQELRERLDATAAAEAMLQEIKLAQKLRPEDEMIELYVRKAQATVYLANWFRDFHHAYLHRRMYFELKDKNRDASLEHVRQGLKLYKSALAELALYANTSPSFGVLGDMYNKMLKATNGWSDRMRKITDAEGEYHE
jgi:hypothetical protein